LSWQLNVNFFVASFFVFIRRVIAKRVAPKEGIFNSWEEICSREENLWMKKPWGFYYLFIQLIKNCTEGLV